MTLDVRLLEIISTRPEMVTHFPEWMLPVSRLARLKEDPGLAIVEIAGRDSFAAALEAVKSGEFTSLLPTIAYTGTEHGSWDTTFRKIDWLREHLTTQGIEVFDPVLLGSPRFWHRLCGRYVSDLFREFGCYSPCPGCHLYLHSIRIPLARMTGCDTIISGERQSHQGKIKINQLGVFLDVYRSFLSEYGVELKLPVSHIDSNDEIADIVGPGWEEGEDQLECVLSQNYLDTDKQPVYSESAILRYFNDFALREARGLVNEFLADI
ncbi:MAG: hypothetical protein R6U89_04105 [Dehalococcoidia bacterium]